MDLSQRDRVRVWSIPGGLVVAAFLAVFWLPVYDAIVHGQITLILTGILALAIGRSPFVRGLLVGLVAALKPPFVLLIPFVSLSFGWRALCGCLLTASLACFPPRLFFDYIDLLPNLSQRKYGDIGLIRLFGSSACLPLVAVICLWIAIRWKGMEASYMGCIAVVVLGTALWFHSYTPLVLPAIYFTTQFLNRRFAHEEITEPVSPPNSD